MSARRCPSLSTHPSDIFPVPIPIPPLFSFLFPFPFPPHFRSRSHCVTRTHSSTLENRCHYSGTTPAIQTILALEITIYPVAINSDGLHHGATKIGRIRPTMGHHRQVHKDGPLPTASREQEDSGRFGSSVRTRNIVTPRTTSQHCLRPGFMVHLGNLKGVPSA